MTEDELADLMAVLPEEIHLVGGPYCGFYLHPHSECVHDVHRDESGGLIPPSDPPTSWSPLGRNAIVMNGLFGSCIYVMESERRWCFSSFLELVGEPLR